MDAPAFLSLMMRVNKPRVAPFHQLARPSEGTHVPLPHLFDSCKLPFVLWSARLLSVCFVGTLLHSAHRQFCPFALASAGIIGTLAWLISGASLGTRLALIWIGLFRFALWSVIIAIFFNGFMKPTSCVFEFHALSYLFVVGRRLGQHHNEHLTKSM